MPEIKKSRKKEIVTFEDNSSRPRIFKFRGNDIQSKWGWNYERVKYHRREYNTPAKGNRVPRPPRYYRKYHYQGKRA
jgi:hypothetical protein